MRRFFKGIGGSVLVAMCALLLLGGARPAQAQTMNSGEVILDLVGALNQGDIAAASRDLTPSFALTMADGTQAIGPNARQALTTLPTPITVVSFQPTGEMMVYAVLQFGSAAPVNVTFTGANAHLATMTIGGPAS